MDYDYEDNEPTSPTEDEAGEPIYGLTEGEYVEVSTVPEPVEDELDQLTVPTLRAMAAQRGIDLGNLKTRAQIVARLRSAASESEADDSLVSFSLASLYEHMPPQFLEALTRELHARGLVEPGDYFQPGAYERFRSAMFSVIKQDFLSVKALAKTAWQESTGRTREG